MQSKLINAANQYGTPLYIYDAKILRDTYQKIHKAIKYNPSKIFYAIVTNGNPFLFNLLVDEGAGIHANTVGDAYIAIRSGVTPENIVLTGTNFTDADFDYIAKYQLKINVDSLQQLDYFLSLGTPVNPGIRLFHPSTGASRIGITRDEIPDAVQLCNEAGRKLAGIHFYRGTGTKRTNKFISPFADIFQAAKEIPDLQYVDIGGGFGFEYLDDRGEGFDWEELGRYLDVEMEKISEYHGRPIELWLEPGRSLIAAAGVLVTQVIDIKKHGDNCFVGTDTSVSNTSVLSVHGGRRRVDALTHNEVGDDILCQVCGSSTYSKDYLARDVMLPPLNKGDLLAILDNGAYGYAMASNFLSCARPAEILIDDGGDIKQIRRRETLDDLLSYVPPLE